MKNLLLFVVLLVVVFACKQDHKIVESIQLIAGQNKATVGELNVITRADTKFKNIDGSYLILNFQSMKKQRNFLSNTGQNISSCLVIENVTDLPTTRKFVKEAGYFILLDKNKNEIKLPEGIWTQTGKEFSEIIIPISDKDFDNLAYVIVGGWDRSMNNGKSRKLFAIK